MRVPCCRRRTNGRQSELEVVISSAEQQRGRSATESFEAVFHTEMQRIDYNVQTPLQLARVDERIDEDRTLRTALAMDSHNPMPLLLCPGLPLFICSNQEFDESIALEAAISLRHVLTLFSKC